MRDNNTLWLATAILLVGATLRLAAFQEALVGADQSSILAAAADIAALRDFPGVGIKSSVGVMQTAIPAYLAALPLFIVHRVIAVKWFFSMLDILALAALYRAVRRTLGWRAASVAAALYATNPWVIEYNRWIWYQSLIPTFATLTFAALLSALSETSKPRPISVTTALVSEALMGLVHLAAMPWAIALAGLTLLVAGWRRWWRQAALGIIGALIIASPYLAFLARGGIADVEILVGGAIEGGEAPFALNTAAYRLSMELLTGRQVLATPRNALWEESVIDWPPVHAIIPVLLGVSALYALVLLGEKRYGQSKSLLLTLLWTFLAPTLFLLSDIHLQHFYLLFIFPAPFVLIGIAVSAPIAPASRRPLLRQLAKTRRTVIALCVVILATWWTHLWAVRIGYEQQGLLRAPTRAWLMDMTVDRITGYLDAAPTREVIILTHFGGESSPFDWIRNFIGTDRVRVVPAGKGLIIPPAETCYLVAERASPEQLALLEGSVTLRPEMTVPASPPWTFHCAEQRPELPEPLAVWENGLGLLGAEIPGNLEPSTELRLMTTWHYRATSRQEYHFFNHLMKGEVLVSQIDGEGLPTRYWRDNDVFITYFALPVPDPLPPGEYELRVGTYSWPTIVRVPLVDGRDAVTIARWIR